MERLSIGQVVLATFPFSDLSSNKLRPCLVLGIADFNDILLCQITSKAYGSETAIQLQKSDFSAGSIVVDSFIRPDKIATLDTSRIKRKLGTVTDTKLTEVKQKLKFILELN
ncbi:MAG TPA: type II toxin-antitoxin system PemK/MazF family toxin [Candidatus Saccharimonadales bacterium]|nr:type II toxin-antitoxin system PemK/MazF family toxin [Candidatus Saccharimonadales bacterium]